VALNHRVKRAGLFALKLAVAGGLLAWLISSGQLRLSVLANAFRTSSLMLLGTFAIYNVCVFLTASRWRMLLVAQGFEVGRLECVRMAYIGCFFSCVLPGGTGGDVVKAYYVARDRQKKAEAVTTVVLDRVFGLYCMLGFASVALLARFDHLWNYPGESGPWGLSQAQTIAVGVLGAFAIATVGVVVLLSRGCRRVVHWLADRSPARLGDVLGRMYEAFYLYRSHPWLLVKFIAYSATAHGLLTGGMWLLGLALDEPLALGGSRALNYLFIIPVGLILNGLPIAPAGIGVFEWSLGLLFASVLAPGEVNHGASVAALGHIVILLTNQIGLFFYLAGKQRIADVAAEPRELSPQEAAPDAAT